jgi:hypothetical protein
MAVIIPHYHVMDSEWGDLVERPIKTWGEAVWLLREQSRCYFDVKRIGKATEGAYFLVEKEYSGEYDPSLADVMLSIYTCTGEQPCPCGEED